MPPLFPLSPMPLLSPSLSPPLPPILLPGVPPLPLLLPPPPILLPPLFGLVGVGIIIGLPCLLLLGGLLPLLGAVLVGLATELVFISPGFIPARVIISDQEMPELRIAKIALTDRPLLA